MTSQKLRCVAIDDEPLALDIISKFCERFGGIELSAYSDPAEGIEVIKKGDFDLAFLDVEMEGINGLEIAAAVPPELVSYSPRPISIMLSTGSISTP